MWPNPKETADLVTFTEEIFSGKLHLKVIRSDGRIFFAWFSVTGSFLKLCFGFLIELGLLRNQHRDKKNLEKCYVLLFGSFY